MKFDGLKNLRDMGGIPLEGGRVVRRGLFLRSDSLTNISEQDCRTLAEDLHLGCIIDLRSDLEVQEMPDVQIPGVEYRHIPMFRDSMIGITQETGANISHYIKRTWNRKAIRAIVPVMENVYSIIMGSEYIVEKVSEAMHLIISNALQGRTTLFHCSQGKDRTGIIAAFILSILGATHEEILSDYVRGGQVYRAKAVKDYVLMVLVKWDAKSARNVFRAHLAKPEFIEATFRSIDELYGGPAEFFRGVLNISDDLRDRFLAVACA